MCSILSSKTPFLTWVIQQAHRDVYLSQQISTTVNEISNQPSITQYTLLNNPWKEAFWKTFKEKEKMMVNSIFSFSHNVFYPLKENSHYLSHNEIVCNFRLFQTERVCRWQFQIWWKRQKAPKMGRKHCGKSRNCSLRAISPFPTVFSKDLYCRHPKTRACLGKG